MYPEGFYHSYQFIFCVKLILVHNMFTGIEPRDEVIIDEFALFNGIGEAWNILFPSVQRVTFEVEELAHECLTVV